MACDVDLAIHTSIWPPGHTTLSKSYQEPVWLISPAVHYARDLIRQHFQRIGSSAKLWELQMLVHWASWSLSDVEMWFAHYLFRLGLSEQGMNACLQNPAFYILLENCGRNKSLLHNNMIVLSDSFAAGLRSNCSNSLFTHRKSICRPSQDTKASVSPTSSYLQMVWPIIKDKATVVYFSHGNLNLADLDVINLAFAKPIMSESICRSPMSRDCVQAEIKDAPDNPVQLLVLIEAHLPKEVFAKWTLRWTKFWVLEVWIISDKRKLIYDWQWSECTVRAVLDGRP